MVALLDAISATALAVLALPFTLVSTTAIVVCVTLAVVATVEFRGRAMLKRYDPRGAVVLGLNQLGLLAVIVAYCLWRIFGDWGQIQTLAPLLADQPELAHLSTAELEQIIHLLIIVVYSAVVLTATIYLGVLSLYFFTRARHAREAAAPPLADAELTENQ